MGRGDLTNDEWARLKLHLPKTGRRGGRWASHRRVINGILFRGRTGVPWRDLPARFGKWKTLYRCTPRQHRPDEGLGRSRGGLTCKIHLAGESGLRPLAFLITPGQWGDAPQLIPVMERVRVARPGGGHPRTRPDHLGGDKAYSSRQNRRYLRRRQIRHTIPEPKNQRTNRQRRGSKGGRPTGFDKTTYKRRNEVERTINALKNSRAVATRYDKRAYIFHGTVTVAAIRLWLRS
ncbi:IS5 family transposase [Streptomyces exfoliatus]|uniref:IS5 family transposase n=1 Tax=Streptomyces exfoliatus TaxID=1905 RepID=UPI003C2D61FE